MSARRSRLSRKLPPRSRAGEFLSWDVHRGGKISRVNKEKNPKSGKVHWVVYQSQWAAYTRACRTPDDLTLILGGEKAWGNVPRNEPVTCLRCQKIVWLNG